MTGYLNPELALVGSALYGYHNLDELFEIARPSDFDDPAHAAVWRAIYRIHDQGERVTVPMVLETAAEEIRGLIAGRDEPEPHRWLSALVDAPHVALLAPQYAKQVALESYRRSSGDKIREMWRFSQNGSETPGEMFEGLQDILDSLAPTITRTGSLNLHEVMEEVLDTAENGQPDPVHTGWVDLDHLITGLIPGRVYVIGARPGVGKSLMGSNIALTVARDQKRAVLCCSMEMFAVELGQRLLAAHASISLTALEHGKLTELMWNRVNEKVGVLMSLPIIVEDQRRQTLSEIRSHVRNAKKAHPSLAVVIVDYLQLVVVENTQNRVEAVGQISRELKMIAGEFGVAVVAMAQVNRVAESRAGSAPALADLRESGSIEADADVVILLHPTGIDDGPDILDAHVAKNRSGPTGHVKLLRNGMFARLQSYGEMQEL